MTAAQESCLHSNTLGRRINGHLKKSTSFPNPFEKYSQERTLTGVKDTEHHQKYKDQKIQEIKNMIYYVLDIAAKYSS